MYKFFCFTFIIWLSSLALVTPFEPSEKQLLNLMHSMRHPCIWKICSKPLVYEKPKPKKIQIKFLTLNEFKTNKKYRCPLGICSIRALRNRESNVKLSSSTPFFNKLKFKILSIFN